MPVHAKNDGLLFRAMLPLSTDADVADESTHSYQN